MRSIRTITSPTIAIAIMIAAIPGSMYMSAKGCEGNAVGVGVVAAGSTANAVTACDGQYDSEPPKLA